jgi:hypothetical protein
MMSDGRRSVWLWLATGVLVMHGLAACGAPAEEINVEATVAVLLTEAAPTATALPAATAVPTPTVPAPPSFDPAVYSNASAGFEFDYPATWLVGPDQQYSRGGITAFTSWDRPVDVLPDATPPGETRLDVTVQLWDPTGDLEAFLGQRRLAWEGSVTILAEERWTLQDGRPAAAFVVQGIDGAQGYFFFTTIGDKYLVLSGDGDLELLAEIAHTVRPTPIEY